MSDSIPVRLPDGTVFERWERPLVFQRTFHVAQGQSSSSDRNPGSDTLPWRTLSRAARELRPGDRVIIHQGVYREWVRPARGGTGPDNLISYEAAPGETVLLKASDLWTPKWKRQGKGTTATYCTQLSPRLFSGANVFCLQNFMIPDMKACAIQPSFELRRGQIFLDGTPLTQVNSLALLATTENAFGVEENGMTIHLRLAADASPQGRTFEITTREQVLAPTKVGLNYIRVKGLRILHAANGIPIPHWQRGALSANGGHHWILEDCEVGHANTVGIDLGARPGGEAIMPHGWQVVRRCHVHHCGVAGICAWPNEANQGFLVEDNLIEDNAWMPIGGHCESAGVKLHYLVNGLVRRNVFRRNRCCGALWLDWLVTNSRVTQNLFFQNTGSFGACFIEINYGPNLVDNNIILQSDRAGFYDHDVARVLLLNNLIAHGQTIAAHLNLGGVTRLLCGAHPENDHRVYGNILAGFESHLVTANETTHSDCNVLGGLKPESPSAPFGFSERDGQTLETWRAHGQDTHSVEIPLDIRFDEQTMLLRVIAPAGARLPEFPPLPPLLGELPPFEQRVEHRVPAGLTAGNCVAPPAVWLTTDFLDRPRMPERYIPGPLLDLPLDATPVNVDPRH